MCKNENDGDQELCERTIDLLYAEEKSFPNLSLVIQRYFVSLPFHNAESVRHACKSGLITETGYNYHSHALLPSRDVLVIVRRVK